jgi:preprotein translocase subunit SecD
MLLAGGATTAAEPSASRVDDSEFFQLRVVAMNERYATVIKAAEAQQSEERDAKRPSTREVKHPESGHIVARWVDVAPSAVQNFIDLKAAHTRTIESAAKTPTLQVLVIADKWNIGHADVAEANASLNDRDGHMVAFQMTDEGAKKLSALTTAHLPGDGTYYHLAIIVGDQTYAAPRIQSAISGRGLITGNFTAKEVEKLVALMNAEPQAGN